MKYLITNESGSLTEVEGEIFTVDQFTCGVAMENGNDEYGDYDVAVVTELSTGMEVVTMHFGTRPAAIKEARRLFFEHDPGKFMMRAKATLNDLGIAFPVNDVKKIKEVANG